MLRLKLNYISKRRENHNNITMGPGCEESRLVSLLVSCIQYILDISRSNITRYCTQPQWYSVAGGWMTKHTPLLALMRRLRVCGCHIQLDTKPSAPTILTTQYNCGTQIIWCTKHIALRSLNIHYSRPAVPVRSTTRLFLCYFRICILTKVTPYEQQENHQWHVSQVLHPWYALINTSQAHGFHKYNLS